jgi:hypothetical protein
MRATPLVRLVLGLLLFGTGCPSGNDPPVDDGIPDEIDGDLRIESEPITIQPGQELFWCVFGSFQQDAGVNTLTLWTDSPYIHHMLLKAVPEDDPHGDGDAVDCLTLGDWWGTAPTLFEAVGGDTEHPDRWMTLPDGVAFMVEAGQRFVLDSHFVNSSGDVATANVAIDLGLVDPAEVQSVAGTFNHDSGPLDIPPQQVSSVSFDCPWEQELTILAIGPHMHAYGWAYFVDWVRDDGADSFTTRILDVPQWDPEMREEPPGIDFPPGEVVLQPGDVFRTECTWNNTTDEALAFPDEMCTTFGVGYPLPGNAYCQAGEPGGGPSPM